VSQLSPRLIALVLLAAVAGGVGLISKGALDGIGRGGGGSGGGDPAAQQVIGRAFNNSNFHSGRFNASFSASALGQALAQVGSRINATMSGAFNNPGNGKPSELDMTFTVDAPSKLNMRVVSTGKAAYISVGGRTYKATAADYARLSGRLGAPQQASLPGLGFNPGEWITDAVNEGAATVDGVATDHISAKLDTDKLTGDLARLSARLGQTESQGLTAKDEQQLKDALNGGRLDVFASKKDGSLRRLQLHVDVKADQGSGSLDVVFNVSDVNKPQTIEAPRSASTRPLSQIESDVAGGFLNPGAAAQSAQETPAPAATPPATAVPSEAQGYLGCVQKAASQQELAACSSLLP
jgi:hypothetical protein